METITEGRESMGVASPDPADETPAEETETPPAGADACAPIESVRAATIECENMLATTMETARQGRMDTESPDLETPAEESETPPAGVVACAPSDNVRAATIEIDKTLATTMETPTEGCMDTESPDLAEKTAESEADKLEAECNVIEQIAVELKYNATQMLEEASKFKEEADKLEKLAAKNQKKALKFRAEADKLEKQGAKNQKKAKKLELDSFMKQQQVDELRNKVDEDAQFVLPDEQVNPGLQENAGLTLKDATKKQGQKALHFGSRANLKNEAKYYSYKSFNRRLQTMTRGFSDKVRHERADDGFFYKKPDMVCFYCGLKITSRRIKDMDLVSLHSKLKPNCKYLIAITGERSVLQLERESL
jgi:hypothetical protein